MFWITKSKQKENGDFQSGVIGTTKNKSKANHMVSQAAAQNGLIVDGKGTTPDGTHFQTGTNPETGLDEMIWAVSEEELKKLGLTE